MACPGAGHFLLGNTRAVFETNYLDAMRVETPQPPGPEIGASRTKKAGPGEAMNPRTGRSTQSSVSCGIAKQTANVK